MTQETIDPQTGAEVARRAVLSTLILEALVSLGDRRLLTPESQRQLLRLAFAEAAQVSAKLERMFGEVDRSQFKFTIAPSG